MFSELVSRLPDPPASYRGTPFWAWNSTLDPEEIRTQIRAFHTMGLGGFFMHSRTGLGTPYLGPEWFDCVRAAVDEAKKLGMQPWMYDEDRWPSGAAGGFVTKNPKFRQQRIEFEPIPQALTAKASKRANTLAWFAVRVAPESSALTEPELLELAQPKDWRTTPSSILSYRRIPSPEAPIAAGEVVVRYYVAKADPATWYNGQTYVDTLNPAAIREFVRVTHEAYLRELGDDFGKVVPGCFTDEPQFNVRAWTGAFAKTFRQKFGYDLLDHLPELFTLVGDTRFSRFRHDYIEVATTLFVKAFSKTIGQWCGKHGLQFTGHAMEEDRLSRQAVCTGSAMRFYEFQQAPGIDQLCERSDIYPTAKQCSSVAHQLGRPYRLVEAYGCTGWDFPLEGHKALGDWLVALGINHRCQHLAWYSMDAEAKRDYPASISRQSPWFTRYKAVEDYFARIGETLGAGSEVIPLLVVHPIESAWGYRLHGNSLPELHSLDAAFQSLSVRLLAEHLDFDYGDEDHLARWARLSARKLRLGKATYEAILLPEMLTIRSSTLALLAKFAARGGRIFTLGTPPRYVDAQPSHEAEALFATFTPVTLNTLSDVLSPCVRRVSIAENSAECRAILYQERQSTDGIALFACNTSMIAPDIPGDTEKIPSIRDRTLAYPNAILRIKAPAKTGRVYELNLMSGTFAPVPYRHARGHYIIEAPFGRLQSRLYLITPNDLPARAPATDTPTPIPIPPEGLRYTLDDDNVLVLDAAAWSIDNGPAQPTTRVLDIDRALRRELGAEPRGGHMTQPWCTAETQPARQLALRLEYTFSCEALPDSATALAIEHPELYHITLNGIEIPNASDAWWIDPCLRRLPIPPEALQLGANHLVLSGPYDETMRGLEAIFLLGAFGVSRDGSTLTPLPPTLRLGDVCDQGLTNYSGNLTYAFTAPTPSAGPIRLKVDSWRGTAIGFRVNHGPETFCPFPPYEATFSDLHRDGSDTFEIIVYGHRRNALGPFYLPGGETTPGWCGPWQMACTEEKTRALVPFGLGAGAEPAVSQNSL